MRRDEKAVLGEIWSSDEAYRNLLHLCDRIGDRWAASDSERAGAAFLRERAAAYGLRDVRLQEFPVLGWQRGPVALRVVEPTTFGVAAIALPYTPPCDLEAEAIFVGQGEEADFERLGEACRDKIVMSLAESTAPPGGHTSHRREKYARAVRAGAAAFLFVNQNPGMMAITGALKAGGRAEIPALGLPRESGAYLERMLADGPVRLAIEIEADFAPSTSNNVLATLGANDGERDYVLTGAHYDAHDIAVGALDNTAGTVVCLEALRAIATTGAELSRPIWMALFGCEEIGLVGAWHYTKTAGPGLDRCRFMFNVDTCTTAVPGEESLAICGFPETVPFFERAAREMAYDFEVRDHIAMYADHFPFAVAGVPSATLGSSSKQKSMIGRGWGHTAADTVDKVNPKSLQAAAALTARLLLRLSREDEWPGRHRPPEEMRRTFEAAPVGWYLKAFGRFPFQPEE